MGQSYKKVRNHRSPELVDQFAEVWTQKKGEASEARPFNNEAT